MQKKRRRGPKRSAKPFDTAAGYDKWDTWLWPYPRLWQVYWYLVQHGSEATMLDVSFALGLSDWATRYILARLGKLRLVHVVQISRPGLRAFRGVYGASLHGLWYCESCDKLFLPMPVREGQVKYCPYCGTDEIKEEPKDERTGYGISDPR